MGGGIFAHLIKRERIPLRNTKLLYYFETSGVVVVVVSKLIELVVFTFLSNVRRIMFVTDVFLR